MPRHARLPLAVLCALLVAPLIAANHSSSAATQAMPAFDHVFVVVMENTSASSIIGNTSQAPYTNSLAAAYSYSSNYFAISHPSLPNYLALTGGSTYGITTDCAPSSCPVNATNIADRIEGSGRSWKAYMESMPSACDTTDSYPYVVKHNPFVYFNDIRNNVSRCQAHDVPMTQLSTDLQRTSTTPNYVFITPNMCNDMHDCSIATGDSWLGSQLPAILASPAFTLQNSLLLLTWDEDDFSGNNRVDLVAAGPQVKRGYVSGVGYNHYSMLSTIESAWNLSALNSSTDGSSAPMTDFAGALVLPTNCVSASVSAGNTGSPVSVTGGSTGCPNPSYEFWVQPPGGAWSLKQGWGGSGFSWSTAGMGPGTYQVGVWARDSTSSRSYDAYGITTHSIGLDGCTSTALAPSVAAPRTRGSKITFTASSTRCGSPQYRFWVLPPGGSWTSVQNYGVGSSWQLDSSLYPAGNVQVGVWARQAGSGNAYDSFFITSYWISPAAGCVATGLNSNASAPQAVGAVVTFSAQQTGCSQQYRFWLLPPGGSWRSVQAYGSPGSWMWNTSGYSSGTYEVGVWAGSASAPGAYTSYAITSFTLGVAGCTSTDVSPNLAAPQAAGVAIGFTASATGCTSPQYEYWLMAPGAAWTMKQGYGSAGWTWNTAGLAPGTYQVGVWARQRGSAASYDTYAIVTYGVG